MISILYRLKKRYLYVVTIFSIVICFNFFFGTIEKWYDLIQDNQFHSLLLMLKNNKKGENEKEILKNTFIFKNKKLNFNNDINFKKFYEQNNRKYYDVKIPFYYQKYKYNFFKKKVNFEKPSIQPFNPKLTIGLYLNKMRIEKSNNITNIEVPFHWVDWVNTTLIHSMVLENPENKPTCKILDFQNTSKHKLYQKIVDQFKSKIFDDKNEREKKKKMFRNGRVLKTESFCLNNFHDVNAHLSPGFNVFKPPGLTNELNSALASKSYLHSYAPNPYKIVFLFGDEVSILHVGEKKSFLKNQLIEKYIQNSKKRTINLMDEFILMNNTININQDNRFEFRIHLNNSMFNFDFEIKDIRTLLSLFLPLSHETTEYFYYKNLISSSLTPPMSAPKYFYEPQIYNTNLGSHFDWRFFSKLNYSDLEKYFIMKNLVTTWLKFCKNNKIITWLSHGSLASWYWNGLSFPWDNDFDFQTTLVDLHKLIYKYNNSLIINDPLYGSARFFFDCNYYVLQREKLNGNNNVDARLIDVDTGFYIDITALAVSNTKPSSIYFKQNEFKGNYFKSNLENKIYNCKNNHFVSLEDLSPLSKTYFFGHPTYVPNNYISILNREYPKLRRNLIYRNFLFFPHLQLWLDKKIIRNNNFNYKLIRGSEEMFNYFFEKKLIYLLNKNFLLFHQQEMLKRKNGTLDFCFFDQVKNLNFDNYNLFIENLINQIDYDSIVKKYNSDSFMKLH